MTPHKCPICLGRGIVPGGFYNSLGDSWSASCISEQCRQCGGLGIIWEKPDPTPSETKE